MPRRGEVRLWRRRSATRALVAQVASSLTSLAVSVGVARVSSVAEFGGFGLMFGTALLIATLVRSFLVEPLIVTAGRSRTVDAAARRARHRSVVGAALLLPAPFALLLSLALWRQGTGLGPVVLVAATPIVVLAVAHDSVRYYAIGTGRAYAAVRADVTWLVVQVAATVLALLGVLSTTGVILGWGVGALAGYVVGCSSLHARPDVWRGVVEAASRWRYGLSWMVDSAIGNAIGQALPWVLAAATGTAAVAAYRGALVLLGPSSVALVAMRGLVLRALSQTEPADVPARTVRLSWLYGAVAFALPAPLLFLPASLGTAILGDSWAVGRGALPLAIAWRVTSAMGTPSLLALRALAETRSLVVLRAWVSVLTLVAGFGGAAAGGAEGAFLGLAVSSGVLLPVWWAAVRRSARRTVAEQAPDPLGGARRVPAA